MLFLHNTSRVDDEPYPTLLRDKGFTGFPSLAFMNAEGDVLMKPKGRSVDAFETGLAELEGYLEMADELAQAKGAERAKLDAALFMTELDLGMLDFAKANQRFHALAKTLSREQVATAKPALHYLEFQQVQRNSRELGPTGTLTALTMMVSGERLPTGAGAMAFWRTYTSSAIRAEDIETSEAGIAKLAELGAPEGLLTSYRKRLDALRK